MSVDVASEIIKDQDFLKENPGLQYFLGSNLIIFGIIGTLGWLSGFTL